MKPGRVTRRRFLLGCLLAAPLVIAADARLLEPTWLKVRKLRLHRGKASHRLVHFTDLHHKGDRDYLQRIVAKINALSPDLVCFTGDIIEERAHLAESLELLAGIKSPLYGVPGNHDYWSKVPFDGIEKLFRGTGGGWLLDRQMVTSDGKLSVIGATCLSTKQAPIRLEATTRNVLLMHYPAWVKKFGAEKFDLLLAGHSHGGQFRVPILGPIHVPFGVDEYDLGLFHTRCGPLYVNPGLGWFLWPIRFNCRPELTVIEL